MVKDGRVMSQWLWLSLVLPWSWAFSCGGELVITVDDGELTDGIGR